MPPTVHVEIPMFGHKTACGLRIKRGGNVFYSWLVPHRSSENAPNCTRCLASKIVAQCLNDQRNPGC